jgi:hypothetical protein
MLTILNVGRRCLEGREEGPTTLQIRRLGDTLRQSLSKMEGARGRHSLPDMVALVRQ